MKNKFENLEIELDTKYRNLANKDWENIEGAKFHVISLISAAINETKRRIIEELENETK